MKTIVASFPDWDYCRDDNFREQIATLTAVKFNLSPQKQEEQNSKNVAYDFDTITLMRDFIYVCQPGSASFDPNNPGTDSPEAWQVMDDYIEHERVCGIFHLHPPGVCGWSEQDIKTQNAMAKTYGDRHLWHGVQAVGHPMSEFTCVWMENGRVFRYNYGMIEDPLDDSYIELHMPITLNWAHGAYIIDSKT